MCNDIISLAIEILSIFGSLCELERSSRRRRHVASWRHHTHSSPDCVHFKMLEYNRLMV